MIRSIIGFFVGNWLYLVAAGVVLGCLYLWGYSNGHEDAAVGCAVNQLEGNKEAEKIHATVENQVNDLLDDALAGELSRWMRTSD